MKIDYLYICRLPDTRADSTRNFMNFWRNKWLILFILGLTWGSSFILIKKSLLVFTPYQIGSVRVAISGLILSFLGIPAIRKMDRSTVGWMMLTGALGNFIPMYLFPIAQTHVSSAMAGILDSLVPVFVLVFGFFLFGIRSRTLQWAGVLAGLAGAAALMYFDADRDGPSQPLYGLLIVLATACYAGSALIVNRKLVHVRSLHLSAGVFTVWAIPALVIFLLTQPSSLPDVPGFWQAAGWLTILSVAGTALAMILYFYLIQQTSAVFASSVTYLIPLVSVMWGLLAGEHFTMWYALGGALILAGIYMIQEQKS